MIVHNVNARALQKAAEFVVGPQATAAIGQLYTIIDHAMKEGYDLGKYEAELNVEDRLNEAFDNGFEHGQEQVETIADAEWDQGYLAGVGDARARPGLADLNIADIVAEQAQHALNGEWEIEVEFYEGDSGDEAE